MNIRHDDFKCPNPTACASDQVCLYGCSKNSVQARYLRQKEIVAQVMLEGPSPQHKAECDCAEAYGQKCVWPKCESALLKVTSVAEENRREAKIEIIKARVAFYSFMWGVGLTLLTCWLFKK